MHERTTSRAAEAARLFTPGDQPGTRMSDFAGGLVTACNVRTGNAGFTGGRRGASVLFAFGLAGNTCMLLALRVHAGMLSALSIHAGLLLALGIDTGVLVALRVDTGGVPCRGRTSAGVLLTKRLTCVAGNARILSWTNATGTNLSFAAGIRLAIFRVVPALRRASGAVFCALANVVADGGRKQANIEVEFIERRGWMWQTRTLRIDAGSHFLHDFPPMCAIRAEVRN